MRSFQFVGWGREAPEGAIACDGLVAGATLDLSHWGGNKTPARYKRDTSTESALVYAASPDADGTLGVVCNNHFDTDGLLAVFALLSPDKALRHRDLLVAAAEAGDFGEWPLDERGLWLDLAIEKLGAGGETRAYARALGELPELLEGIEQKEELWREGWTRLQGAWTKAQAGAMEVWPLGAIAVFAHREGVEEMPSPVLSRSAPRAARRWLIALDRGGGRWDYRYERPRWAWADTVDRPPIAAPSRNACARELGPGWALKGELGMTGILRTIAPVRLAPREVAQRLAGSDPGLSSTSSAARDAGGA